jgi:hypothetical protein
MAASHRFVVSLLGAMLAAAPAMAQQVGTATAVNPLSESTPPGGATGPLQVGAHIVHNEKIHTTPNGTAQLLFTDKSSLSIAPNTSIVIDEYVYDPNAQNGHMLVSLAKGALRYVGGQLSHQGEALITTSAATIGIRGGTVTVIHGPNGTEVIDHFGIITIHNQAGTFVLRRSDFKVLIPNAHVLPSEAIRVGSVQLLFLDHSSLSLAPNTSIVIDDFVYDPNSGNGHMLATLTHGALRYVGGALSHEGETTIKTANAAIGIRGGTDTITQGPNGTTVTNHHGTVTISNNVKTITFSHWPELLAPALCGRAGRGLLRARHLAFFASRGLLRVPHRSPRAGHRFDSVLNT